MPSLIAKVTSPGDPIYEVKDGRILRHTVISLNDKYREIFTDLDILDYSEAGKSWFFFYPSALNKLKELKAL